MNSSESVIAIIGLGYVGLPLAVEFGKKYPTLGFDINQKRIHELAAFSDHTLEVESSEIQAATHLRFSSDRADLKRCSGLTMILSRRGFSILPPCLFALGRILRFHFYNR